MGARVEKPAAKPGGPVLRVRDLSLKDRLDGLSFEVRAGEIVGIAGVEGNGQTELIEESRSSWPASAASAQVVADRSLQPGDLRLDYRFGKVDGGIETLLAGGAAALLARNRV